MWVCDCCVYLSLSPSLLGCFSLPAAASRKRARRVGQASLTVTGHSDGRQSVRACGRARVETATAASNGGRAARLPPDRGKAPLLSQAQPSNLAQQAQIKPIQSNLAALAAFHRLLNFFFLSFLKRNTCDFSLNRPLSALEPLYCTRSFLFLPPLGGIWGGILPFSLGSISK